MTESLFLGQLCLYTRATFELILLIRLKFVLSVHQSLIQLIGTIELHCYSKMIKSTLLNGTVVNVGPVPSSP